MKFLILLSLMISSIAFASNGKIDYCMCYHSSGKGELANFIRNNQGQITSVARPALKYTMVKDRQTLNAIVANFYRAVYNPSNIASAEVILLAQNLSSGRERHMIIFRDKKGSLISMSDNWAGNVSDCEGTKSGLKSLCAASDGSVLELAK